MSMLFLLLLRKFSSTCYFCNVICMFTDRLLSLGIILGMRDTAGNNPDKGSACMELIFECVGWRVIETGQAHRTDV